MIFRALDFEIESSQYFCHTLIDTRFQKIVKCTYCIQKRVHLGKKGNRILSRFQNFFLVFIEENKNTNMKIHSCKNMGKMQFLILMERNIILSYKTAF